MVNMLFAMDLMEKDVLFVNATDKVYDMVTKMVMNYTSYALVRFEGTVTGIVTYSDIVTKVVNAERNLHQVTARDIMAQPIEEISTDTLVLDACDIMKEKGVDKLLVKEGGDVKGVLTESAIIKNIHRLTGE